MAPLYRATTPEGRSKEALNHAVLAFRRALQKGYAWVDEEGGGFVSHEDQLAFMPDPPPDPNQLRLC